MEVANLKQCTAYTCKVSYPKVNGEQFINSVEVSGMTEIPPPSISQIPPPIPLDASALFQNGADYIQVRWTAPAEMTPCIDGYQVAWRENLDDEEEEFNIVDIDQPDIFSWKLEEL